MFVALFVNPFVSTNMTRQNEYETAFVDNLKNSGIDRLCLLGRDCVQPYMNIAARLGLSGRLVVNSRFKGDADGVPSYADFFAAATRLKPVVAVVANLDIYFDETIAKLKLVNLTGRFLAVSRLDHQVDGTWQPAPRQSSQDAWIFAPPIKVAGAETVFMGRRGCDNKIAALAQAAGLKVSDPGLDLNIFHAHSSEYRIQRWKDKIPPPYLYLDRQRL